MTTATFFIALRTLSHVIHREGECCFKCLFAEMKASPLQTWSFSISHCPGACKTGRHCSSACLVIEAKGQCMRGVHFIQDLLIIQKNAVSQHHQSAHTAAASDQRGRRQKIKQMKWVHTITDKSNRQGRRASPTVVNATFGCCVLYLFFSIIYTKIDSKVYIPCHLIAYCQRDDELKLYFISREPFDSLLVNAIMICHNLKFPTCTWNS